MRLKFGNVEIFPPNYTFDFMKWRGATIGISLAMVVASLLVIAIKGVNYSIDFLGGAEIHVSITDTSFTREKVLAIAEQANVGKPEVTSIGDPAKDGFASFVLRVQRERGQDEKEIGGRADELYKKLEASVGADKIKLDSKTNISGKIGKEEERKGYFALLLSFLGILAYIALRFDARFSPGAVLCLVHDVIIALGFMTALDRPFSTSSIAAFLTIVGYSINDTVIVYDRIRETQETSPKMGLVDIINRSISQTMNRTVLTSATGLGALLILTFLGGGAIEDFALTMFVGILVGTYSSIYVAAPLTIWMDEHLKRWGWRPAETAQKAKQKKDPNEIPPVIVRRRPS
ncbi:MAG: protein translocase subunit SecF [Pseudomonadota bacterium]|jgi:preprotein translocase subunit SecF